MFPSTAGFEVPQHMPSEYLTKASLHWGRVSTVKFSIECFVFIWGGGGGNGSSTFGNSFGWSYENEPSVPIFTVTFFNKLFLFCSLLNQN